MEIRMSPADLEMVIDALAYARWYSATSKEEEDGYSVLIEHLKLQQDNQSKPGE